MLKVLAAKVFFFLSNKVRTNCDLIKPYNKSLISLDCSRANRKTSGNTFPYTPHPRVTKSIMLREFTNFAQKAKRQNKQNDDRISINSPCVYNFNLRQAVLKTI